MQTAASLLSVFVRRALRRGACATHVVYFIGTTFPFAPHVLFLDTAEGGPAFSS